MAAISAIILLSCLSATFFCIYKFALLLIELKQQRPLPLRLQVKQYIASLQESVLAIPAIHKLSAKSREHKRTEELQKEMPNVLRLLCISLESGSSMTMALRYAAENCNGTLADELKRTVWDLDAGQGFDEALEKLRGRTGGSEFGYLAIAMEIQHQSGGSMSDILESVSAMLKQASDLKEELKTKTAQGRLSSRIVTLMPFILLGILSLFSPGYLGGFISSPLGVCLFVVALLFETLGIFLVKRALAVDFTIDLEGAV